MYSLSCILHPTSVSCIKQHACFASIFVITTRQDMTHFFRRPDGKKRVMANLMLTLLVNYNNNTIKLIKKIFDVSLAKLLSRQQQYVNNIIFHI